MWRIQFKLATLTFKALHTGCSPYLTDLLQHHQSTRSLRSSSSHQLLIPRHNLSFGSRAFRFSAPRIWNKLPLHIRETQSLPAFKRQLTPPPSDPPSNAPWFFNRLWRYISSVLTYLLTYLYCSGHELTVVNIMHVHNCCIMSDSQSERKKRQKIDLESQNCTRMRMSWYPAQ